MFTPILKFRCVGFIKCSFVCACWIFHLQVFLQFHVGAESLWPSPVKRLLLADREGRSPRAPTDKPIVMCSLAVGYTAAGGYTMCCVCVCSVTQLCLTLCDPMECSPRGSSVYGISQARILEWVAISYSRESSQSRVEPMSITSLALAGGFFFFFFYHCTTIILKAHVFVFSSPSNNASNKPELSTSTVLLTTSPQGRGF